MSPPSAGAEKVRDTIDGAEDVRPEPPPHEDWPETDFGLLGADQAPAPELKPDTLPAMIMDWCKETATASATPVDYVVANVLAAASGWLGNSRRVRATHSWIEPPHLWFACVGSPSTGKTPAVRPFIEVSHNLEADNEKDWKETLTAHERDTERAKAKADVWKADVKEAVKQSKAAPDMPLDAITPEPPIRPRVLIADATVQEIGNILSGNPRGLLQIRDELSGWLGSMDQFSGAGSDRAFYLESWNGGAYTIDRVKHGGQPVRIRHCSLAIAGGLQPDKLKEALNAADDGLAARFAYIWPEPLPYRDLNIEQDGMATERINALAKVSRRLHGLAMARNDHGEPLPSLLSLDEDGLALLNEIRRDATARARAAHRLSAGWHGKTPTRVLRLALVIEHLRWAMAVEDAPSPTVVTAESIAYAGAYVDYLAEMFERVMAGLQIDHVESDAAMVARLLIREKLEKINERALYQRAGFSFLRNRDRCRRVFDALAGAGFIRRPAVAKKGRPSGDWDVNPRVKDYCL
jgi:hypothetical protein